MIKNNYHTHVSYCNHAVGTVEDYVIQAIENQFEELGMTDHAPILETFMDKDSYIENYCDQNMKLETAEIYLSEIKECQKKYKDKIKIYSGFESEYLFTQHKFYQELRKKVDYLNLGLHFYAIGSKIYNTYQDVNNKTLQGYVDTAVRGMQSGLFNTLVHPDLYFYDYKDEHGNHIFDDACIKAARTILDAAIKNNVYVEVNAGGVRNSQKHGCNTWLYPVKEFWLIAKEYKDLKILIGADAHDPKDLASESVEQVCEFCESLGLHIHEKMEIHH